MIDMQKARGICRALPKYLNGASPSKESAAAAKLLPSALDEIDRLNRHIASSNEWYAVRIKLLEDFFRAEGQDLPIAKTFWDILANGHRSPSEPPAYDYILTAKDHEIARLREALIEERAFSMSAAASCPGGSPDCYGIDWDKIGEDAARKTLEKEGKI